MGEWIIKRYYIAHNEVEAKNKKEAINKGMNINDNTEYEFVKITVKRRKIEE